MTIGDTCRRNVATARPRDTVRHAVELMSEHNVGTVVITNERREPVGILTDRDIALRVVLERLDAEAAPLEQVMHGVVVTIHEDESFAHALRRMADNRVRRLPVVRRGSGELCGIVALDDLLRQIGREMHDVAALVEAESRPWSLDRL